MKKDGWKYKKLGEVCGLLNGFAFDSNDFTEDSSYMPLIRIRDVKRGYSQTYYKGLYKKEYVINKGDYIIGMDGEFNIGIWNSVPSLLNQRVCKIIPNNKLINERFIYYYVPIELSKLESKANFVTVKHLSSKQILNISLPIPPLPIQHQIVSHLDKLNEIIDKQRELLKVLDKLEQSIFYEMFGDPVNNEKGWEVSNINSICSSIVRGPFGSDLKKEYFVGKGPNTYKVYEQKHAIQKKVNIGTYYIDEEKFKSLKKFSVNPQDIIMSCSGTIGELYTIPQGVPKGIINQALLKFSLNKAITNYFFLFLMDIIKKTLDVKGCGIKNIGSIVYIKSLKFGLPPLPLQQSFAARITHIEQQKQAIQSSIDKFQEMLDGAMQEYFGDD